jgi:hypothetical protein
LANAQNFPSNAKIDNNHWLDSTGKFIHAHGGQIFLDGGVYYWVGTTEKLAPNYLSEGINCYRSTDLNTWTFVHEIFHNTSVVVTSNKHAYPPWRIERPKVLYDEATKEFVMWFHLDTSSFSLTSVGVAKCSSVCGDYQWVSEFEPDGLSSYDMGLYQDNTDAYLVRSVQNSYCGISPLTSTYEGTTSQHIVSQGPKMEGNCMFKLSTYYLVGSHLTGWAPNAAILCVTPNNSTLVNAKWSSCNNPTTSSTTYGSQSTFVTRFHDTTNKKYAFMFMADIWNAPNVETATYLWLPIVFKSNGPMAYPSIPYMATWMLVDYTVDIP